MIAGGLGGLGRSTARWMVSRGARNLILLSRSGAHSDAAMALVEELTTAGVHVETPRCDITVVNSLHTALRDCTTMPPIKGCIQACMQLRDAIFEKMAYEDWKVGVSSKVQGTWNLHNLLPRGMDFFICLSSVSGIVGAAATANYSAGNAFMDAFVRYRVLQGEKATSLDLGWMISEGTVAESEFLSNTLASSGFLIPISPAEFHALLDRYCDSNLEIATPMTCQAVVGLETPEGMQAKDMPEPHWMKRQTFLHMQRMGQGEATSRQQEKAVNYAQLLRDAATLEEAAQAVTDGLVHKCRKRCQFLPKI